MTKLGVIVCVAAACSNAPVVANTQTCAFDLSGNVVTTATTPACASIAQTDAGAELVIDTTTATTGRVQATINLGATATAANLTSDNVVDWSAVILGFGDANCVLSAGSGATPHGAFNLELADVPDAGPPHGAITIQLSVEAPPKTSCGAGDTETVHVAF